MPFVMLTGMTRTSALLKLEGMSTPLGRNRNGLPSADQLPKQPGGTIIGAMGIRFYCPNGHKLNVKEFQAGRKGICPFCGAKIQIPTESTRPSSRDDGSSRPSQPGSAPAGNPAVRRDIRRRFAVGRRFHGGIGARLARGAGGRGRPGADRFRAPGARGDVLVRPGGVGPTGRQRCRAAAGGRSLDRGGRGGVVCPAPLRRSIRSCRRRNHADLVGRRPHQRRFARMAGRLAGLARGGRGVSAALPQPPPAAFDPALLGDADVGDRRAVAHAPHPKPRRVRRTKEILIIVSLIVAAIILVTVFLIVFLQP